jgi:hypothetical protein
MLGFLPNLATFGEPSWTCETEPVRSPLMPLCPSLELAVFPCYTVLWGIESATVCRPCPERWSPILPVPEAAACVRGATHVRKGPSSVEKIRGYIIGDEQEVTCGADHLNPRGSGLERWNAGGRDALRLFREHQRRGYPESDATVARYAQRVCQAPRQQPPRQPLPVVAEPQEQLLTAWRAAWPVLRREEKRAGDKAPLLAQLRAQQAAVAEAIDLAQDFARLTR